MALEAYREKRNFTETPEPSGEVESGAQGLRFVVQKHRASHLHYDFRLELDGVMKSWAVPKGPSTDPADKRLAMMVEDHPLDYRTFEGTIPSGNYGAGTVMVWDEGTYRPRQPGRDRSEDEALLRRALERGHITFVLDGTKLRGEWALLKLRRGEPNAWLLVKKGDDAASTTDVREQDRSATSGRTMDEIAAGEPLLGQQPVTPIDLEEFPESAMPRELRPMLAGTATAPFDRSGWLFEIKWDGYRAVAQVTRDDVQLRSRTGQSFNERFSVVAAALRRLGHEAVLDGEVVALDEAGKPHFQSLQHGDGQMYYYVFDLLWLDGHSLLGAPLRRRKEILRRILGGHDIVRFGEHVEERGAAFFEVAAAQGLEGVIAKDSSAPYAAGSRSDRWLKIKAQRQQEAVIGGFTAPRGSRKDLGALVLGVYCEGGLRYVGHTGTGFDDKTLAEIRARLEPLIRPTMPFEEEPRTNAPVTWVAPTVVCRVGFQEWTRSGVMRHPVFLGLRDDKPASSVRAEQPIEPLRPTSTETPGRPADPPANESREAIEEAPRRHFTLVRKQEQEELIDGHRVCLTNLKKVYWPDERYTKGDLIAYYREMAPVLLPYLRDRPESLNRHPNGIAESSFFQKDMAHQPPDWAQTIDLQSDSEDREIAYLLCQNEATLVYMANLGCIELNPWNSRVASLDRPDYLVIDLDPEAIPFTRVIETALTVRTVLESADIPSVPKTSGSRGLHIYVPLGARYSYQQCRDLAHVLAQLVQSRLPEWTSLERSPSRRQGKVYLDYLQNRRGQTLAAPYSVRPRRGAPVSMPLRWEEVAPGLEPGQFTIKTAPARLDRVGDLWPPVLGPGIDMVRVLQRLGEWAAAG